MIQYQAVVSLVPVDIPLWGSVSLIRRVRLPRNIAATQQNSTRVLNQQLSHSSDHRNDQGLSKTSPATSPTDQQLPPHGSSSVVTSQLPGSVRSTEEDFSTEIFIESLIHTRVDYNSGQELPRTPPTTPSTNQQPPPPHGSPSTIASQLPSSPPNSFV